MRQLLSLALFSLVVACASSSSPAGGSAAPIASAEAEVVTAHQCGVISRWNEPTLPGRHVGLPVGPDAASEQLHVGVAASSDAWASFVAASPVLDEQERPLAVPDVDWATQVILYVTLDKPTHDVGVVGWKPSTGGPSRLDVRYAAIEIGRLGVPACFLVVPRDRASSEVWLKSADDDESKRIGVI
ncbi:MAG: hypothetical protein RMA76_18885 [Deltaproteobacteria bacterium]|jgi:hypothetical protein